MRRQVKPQGDDPGALFVPPGCYRASYERKFIMLTLFIIDVLIITAVVFTPLAVWYAWRYGVIELMRVLGLHSEEDLAQPTIARRMKEIRQETAWTFAHDSNTGAAYLADKKNQGKVYTRSGELNPLIVAEIWEMDFFFSYCKHNSFNNTDGLMQEYKDLAGKQ